MDKGAIKYGRSLYDLAKEENKSKEIFDDFEGVVNIIGGEPDYIRLMSEPSISKAQRTALIDEAFAGKIDTYLLSFLKILCENEAFSEIKPCFEVYRNAFYEDNNISVAKVTSAAKLNEAQLEALKKKLEGMSGKSIIIQQKTDKSFIAGLRVELDGKLYDSTALGRLEAIKKKVSNINL